MRITIIFIAFLMGVSGEWSHACAQETDKLPSFPGAEGFGRYTTGGRGGTVYHVTTLEDGDFKGTLRHAVNQRGPRNCLLRITAKPRETVIRSTIVSTIQIRLFFNAIINVASFVNRLI